MVFQIQLFLTYLCNKPNSETPTIFVEMSMIRTLEKKMLEQKMLEQKMLEQKMLEQ
jgi:hypothetical protein